MPLPLPLLIGTRGGMDFFDNGPFVFRLNENGTGPNLLAQVCVERGWREYSAASGDHWNLWWRTSGFPLNQYRLLKPWQYSNHIPKGSSICRKDSLARYLRCMLKVHGAIYDFTPTGYNLPLEYTKLVAECSRQPRHGDDGKVWICKPVGQSQGRGIFLFRRLSELCYDNNAVVQRYIENPLLIGGYKFDLRLYVCIPSYHPLVVYVYREGLARFGTDKFTLADLDNPFRHLTNSSLNKLGPGYAENKERVGAGCKWTLKQLRHYFQQVGLPDWLLWQRIAALVILTVLSQMHGIPDTANCFEFYGFDVLVDSDLRPWLLEVNLSPALGNDCDVDSTVKKPMLHDMFDLLGLPVSNTGLSLFTVWSPPTNRDSADARTQPMGGDGGEGDDLGDRKPEALSVVAAAQRWRRKQKKPPAAGVDRHKCPVLTHVNLNQQLTARGIARPDCAPRCDAPAPGGVWGNSRDWRGSPPAGEGGWTRVYPLVAAARGAEAEEARAVVAAVHKYARAAKEIAKRVPAMTDEASSAMLKHALKMDAEVWLPQM